MSGKGWLSLPLLLQSWVAAGRSAAAGLIHLGGICPHQINVAAVRGGGGGYRYHSSLSLFCGYTCNT
jgi:hypothetical protein